MRSFAIATLLALGLVACARPVPENTERDRNEQTDERMRQAGRTAYDAAQKAEQAAKELGREVERAGKNARQGWDQAKREHDQKNK